MRAVVIIAVAVALAGCSTTASVPASMLTCAPQPASPEDGTQRDVALYVIELASAGEDCRSKLGSVRRILGAKQ